MPTYDEEDSDISLVADPTFAWTAGGMVSTPCDLARWGASLYGGDVLSAKMLELMVTPGDHNAEYGHGSFVEIDGTQALHNHTDGIGGSAWPRVFQTFDRRRPKKARPSGRASFS